MAKNINAINALRLGIIKGLGMDALTFKDALNGFKEAFIEQPYHRLFDNPFNNAFNPKTGKHLGAETLELFAEKGHPENKKITAMAKKFQKEFGNVPMKNWKLADNPRQKTLMPADKSLHSKYKKSIRDFHKAWMRDSKKGGWYLP